MRIAIFTMTLAVALLPSQARAIERGDDPADHPALLFARTPAGTVTVPNVSTDVRVEVSGAVVRTTLRQTFLNPFEEPVDVTYVYPLAHDAAVDRFAMRIGERLVEGEILRKPEAREAYAQAAAEGYTASIVEQDRPNVFVQNVANVAPGESVVIEVGSVATLAPVDGTYEVRLPLVVEDRYDGRGQPGRTGGGGGSLPPGRFTVAVDLEAATPILSVGSPTHEIEERRSSNRRTSIVLASGGEAADRDFVLRWDVIGDRTEAGVLVHRDDVDGTLALILNPGDRPAATRPPWRFVFLVDVSTSMAGHALGSARRFLHGALDALGDEDEVALVDFSDGTSAWRAHAVRAGGEDLRDARRWVASRKTRGGTKLERGLRAALEFAKDAPLEVAVVVVTDALVGTDDEVLELIAKHPDVRFFPIGVGAAANHDLRERIARVGHGATVALAGPDDVHTALARFAAWCGGTSISDLEVDWGALPVGDVEPDIPRDWYGGQPLVVLARYWGAARGAVVVRGTINGEPWEQRIEVDLPERSPRHAALGTVWARRRIERMHDAHGYSPPDEVREEITALALAHRLMSAYTSFVAVDRSRVVAPVRFAPAAETLIEEAVVVYASADPLDRPTFRTDYSDDFIQNLPVPGRFYQGVLTMAPGVQDDGVDGEVTVHGSRSRDFKTLVGGVSNVDPLTGWTMGRVNPNSIEEMEVITAGAGVEYGRAQGGFANIIQKQGSNEFEGGARAIAGVGSVDDAGRAPSTLDTVGASTWLAGPLAPDRLWAHGGMHFEDVERAVDTTRRVERVDARHVSANAGLTWQVSPRNRLALALTGSDELRAGVGTTALTDATSARRLDDRIGALSATWTAPVSPKLWIEARASASTRSAVSGPTGNAAVQDCSDDPALAAARCWDATAGSFLGASPFRFDDDVRELGARVDVHAYVPYGGLVKAGVAISRETWSRDLDRAPDLFRGVGPAGVDLVGRFAPDGGRVDSRSGSGSAWLGFEARPVHRVVVTLGLRYDREALDAPGRAPLEGLAVPVGPIRVRRAVWSPRVALTWSSSGENAKVEASLGRYHGPLQAVLGAVGSEPATWDLVLDGAGTAPDLVGPPTGLQTLAADLDVPFVDEWALAVAFETLAETTLRIARLERRGRAQIGARTIEVAAPGGGGSTAVTEIGNSEWFDHQAWIVTAVRRQYRGWEASASYTWSRTRGSADAFDPVAGDLRALAVPVEGDLSTDRRHEFEVRGMMITPWGFRVSGRAVWHSGLPYSNVVTRIERLDGDRVRIRRDLPDGRNTLRNPSAWTVDVRLSKEFRAGSASVVRVVLDVANLLDDRTRIVRDAWSGTGRNLDGFDEAVRVDGRLATAGVEFAF